MLAKRIIACLDVKDGRVVKGTGFLRLRDAGDPAALAARYSREGADEIVFLDISASLEGRATRLDWVRAASKALDVPFTVGGGIRSAEDIRGLLRAGADKVSVNTAAIRRPGLVRDAARRFGSQCVVVAIDAKREKNGWAVYSNGGTKEEPLDAVEWAKRAVALGAGEILLTSIDADGSRRGFDLGLTRAVCSAVSVPVIASGGAGSPRDFLDVFEEGGADAALAAGVFHYGMLSIPRVKRFLRRNGVLVR
ncbi:MAG: imidazole glycerol phosphate synthase subunit HisF [Candidatus Micrarchaeota archaeon]